MVRMLDSRWGGTGLIPGWGIALYFFFILRVPLSRESLFTFFASLSYRYISSEYWKNATQITLVKFEPNVLNAFSVI